MFIFKHSKDLNQLPPGSSSRVSLALLLDRLAQTISTAPGYAPEGHGYVVLIEAVDIYRQRILPELPYPLAQVPWEGVILKGGFFHAVVLTNNQFAIDFLIPNEPWLTGPIRKSLEDHLPI